MFYSSLQWGQEGRKVRARLLLLLLFIVVVFLSIFCFGVIVVVNPVVFVDSSCFGCRNSVTGILCKRIEKFYLWHAPWFVLGLCFDRFRIRWARSAHLV